MGLDSYFRVKSQEEKWVPPPFAFSPPLALCGGLLSGNGNEGSFRGKVYDAVVEGVTGESLYQELIEHDAIVTMADKLGAVTFAEALKYGDDLTEREFADLVRLFEAAAKDENVALLGWW